MKLIVISHALCQNFAQKRWRLMAKKYDIEVHLIVPKIWKSIWFKDEITYSSEATQEDNFFIHPLATTSDNNWGKYFYISLDLLFKKINPDIIYVVHEEMIWVHQQVLLYKRLFAPKAKYVFFSMNAMGVPDEKWHQRHLWRSLKKGADAAVCHYTGCEESLKNAGFSGPLLLQTQIGVDEDLFYPNPQSRVNIRKKYNLEDSFVLGFVGRMSFDKGVDTLIKALPKDLTNFKLLLVGNGHDRAELELLAKEQGIFDRIIFVGTVNTEEVPDYMNAMDIFCIASKTTPHWIDTFPLVSVQAMSCKVPVIGSNSGAIPWQIKDCGVIFPEGDSNTLNKEILELANNSDKRELTAENCFQHVRNTHCLIPLVDQLHTFFQDLLKD